MKNAYVVYERFFPYGRDEYLNFNVMVKCVCSSESRAKDAVKHYESKYQEGSEKYYQHYYTIYELNNY